MKNSLILIVDDDPKIRTLLRRFIEGSGGRVREAADKNSALVALENEAIDLITLDLDLGQDDGLDIARAIRAVSKVPIVMITAKDDVIDRVVGLEIGADDYITKPFHLREVVARINSVLRRTSDKANTNPALLTSQIWKFDGMSAIPEQMRLLDRNGNEIELTSGEFKLLEVFLTRPKRVLSREQLMDLIGGHTYAPLDRTIDNKIARLRKKIERNPSTPKLISTIRYIGYSFTCDVQKEAARAHSDNADITPAG